MNNSLHISTMGYSKSSRDSVRVSDVSNMKTSLELFYLNSGEYPLPDNGAEVKYSGNTLWVQGIFGENVISQLSRNLSEIPTDSLTDVLSFRLGDYYETSYLTLNSNTAILDNQWYHIAVTRDNLGSTKIFIDGYLKASGTYTENISNRFNLFINSPVSYVGEENISGNIDEIRISKGISRTSDENDFLYIDPSITCNLGVQCFTPPTVPYGN